MNEAGMRRCCAFSRGALHDRPLANLAAHRRMPSTGLFHKEGGKGPRTRSQRFAALAIKQIAMQMTNHGAAALEGDGGDTALNAEQGMQEARRLI